VIINNNKNEEDDVNKSKIKDLETQKDKLSKEINLLKNEIYDLKNLIKEENLNKSITNDLQKDNEKMRKEIIIQKEEIKYINLQQKKGRSNFCGGNYYPYKFILIPLKYVSIMLFWSKIYCKFSFLILKLFLSIFCYRKKVTAQIIIIIIMIIVI
jgi:hypothetical protein